VRAAQAARPAQTWPKLKLEKMKTHHLFNCETIERDFDTSDSRKQGDPAAGPNTSR
jgi:hypothetical protein